MIPPVPKHFYIPTPALVTFLEGFVEASISYSSLKSRTRLTMHELALLSIQFAIQITDTRNFGVLSDNNLLEAFLTF